MKTYDAIIVGGGAGLKIARPAANLGFKIAVVEEKHLGGTCLNRGCIPSKMLIHPADVIQQIKEANLLNIHVDKKIKIDFKELVHYVSETIDKESKSIYPLLQNHKNIDLYQGSAQFIDQKTIQVNSSIFTAKKFFLAAGARPYIPNIKGLSETPFITSTEALRMETLPKTIAILGGGYIACELGHYLDAMGADVHFIVRSSFLRHLDDSLKEHFQKIFTKRFKVTYAEPSSVQYKNNEFIIKTSVNEIKAEAFLVAAGVTPNSDTLHLDKTGVQLDERGFVKVNEFLETTCPSIYAYGDIIGRFLFRHSANFEGEYLLKHHFQDLNHLSAISYPPVPYGVFTWPQIGGVGKIERELKSEKRAYIVGLNHYENSAMGMALRKEEGLVKLLFDANTFKLLGGHVIGEQATTMCHMIIAYMKMKATLDDLLETIYVHPALSENIRNAARKAKEQVKQTNA